MISKNNKVGLSDRLKELRENKGLTQQEFAELLDLSRVSIGAYEKGTAIPNTETLIKISNIFKVSLDWLCCTEMNAKKDKYEIKNYKDAFLSLQRVMSEFYRPFQNGCDKDNPPPNEYTVTYELSHTLDNEITTNHCVDFKIYDETLHSIFSDFNDMNKLLKKEAITEKLYSSWYDGFCKKLADIPTPKHQNKNIEQSIEEYLEHLEDFDIFIKNCICKIEKNPELTTSQQKSLKIHRETLEQDERFKVILNDILNVIKELRNETDNGGETNGNSTKKG